MFNNSIKEFEKFAPINYILTPKNEFVIDFGQILSGYTEIRIKGRKGDKIVVHHKEKLDNDGNFSPKNTNQTLTYILNSENEETNQLFRDKMWEQKNNLKDDTSDFEEFFKSLCGISIDREKDPQDKYIIIEPNNDTNHRFSNSALETVCGRLEINRYINSDDVHYEINIPDGITALLKLPGRRVVEKEGGNYIFICKQ